ncbi:hypothetical protein M0813_27758 [Anaeramoeba flamelloides]|uniref:Protein kinase domain-containing protein n=1 Tax=Anaeramoeba flamelloides TaxID=1746091 RepID=A0AAV8A811_9EUKA|nr:hypothetical protein M0812_01392 [Anaeramoeba flamelloides]KAJ6236371.1 hypothetical protein M0813_27758 [Anaeramoeba flamelloides]
MNKFFRRLKPSKKNKGTQKQKKPIEKYYELGEVLGQGTFSTVKKAIDKRTGLPWAIKILPKSGLNENFKLVENEIEILSTVDHPNVIRMHEIFETTDKIYIVMEIVTGGELFDRIERLDHLTEQESAYLIKKILNALKYLHSKGIVHRDLKPENLLLSDNTKYAEIKLTDFGLSKVMSDQDVMKTACGTPIYVAPEILSRKIYGPQVDVWSTGIILYVLLSGCAPFYDENLPVLFNKIKRGKIHFPSQEWENISESAKDLIRKFLIVDPLRRITVEDALNHEWILKNGDYAEEKLSMFEFLLEESEED